MTKWPGRKVLPTERSRLNLNDPKGPISKTQRILIVYMHVHTCTHTHTQQREKEKREHSEVPSPFLPGLRKDGGVPVLRGPALELQASPLETQLCSSPIQPSNLNMFLCSSLHFHTHQHFHRCLGKSKHLMTATLLFKKPLQ